MKKLVSLLAAVLLVTTIFPVSAFAHGHCGSGNTGAGYPLCSVKDCDKTDSHRHSGTWYSGHSISDGHTYHEVCSVSGCTLTTSHEHDGVTCWPHSTNDGHSYHASGHKSGGGHR